MYNSAPNPVTPHATRPALTDMNVGWIFKRRYTPFTNTAIVPNSITVGYKKLERHLANGVSMKA